MKVKMGTFVVVKVKLYNIITCLVHRISIKQPSTSSFVFVYLQIG